jgi:hypothetical protein
MSARTDRVDPVAEKTLAEKTLAEKTLDTAMTKPYTPPGKGETR